ncbi:MAG: ATP:cob(I)alamin adenosyltransferase [Patescibacteria group bacterium]
MNTKFFTGAGDAGETGFGQKKISKDDALFDVLGGLDAVNAFTGWCAVCKCAFRRARKQSFIQIVFVREKLYKTFDLTYNSNSYFPKEGCNEST